MAALTTIRNPDNQKDVLIFYTTNNYQVGYDIAAEDAMDQKDDGSGDGGARGNLDDSGARAPTLGCGDDKEQLRGLVRHPSAFQALRFQNLIKVYGITRENEICELSPGIRSLKPKIKTTSGGLAGCGNGNDLAWLYYLSGNEVPQLKQFVLATGASVAVQGPPTPDQESCLSAWYKDRDQSRGVVYQNKNNTNLKFWEVKSDGAQNNGDITNTTQAAKKTPIATTCKEDVTYLYFVSSSNTLIRADRTGSGSWTNQKDDSSNSWNLNPITATLALNGKYIVVRQQYTDDNGWYEFKDTREIH